MITKYQPGKRYEIVCIDHHSIDTSWATLDEAVKIPVGATMTMTGYCVKQNHRYLTIAFVKCEHAETDDQFNMLWAIPCDTILSSRLVK